MNRWKPFVLGLVIALLAGVSLSYAQGEGAEDPAIGLAEEEATGLAEQEEPVREMMPSVAVDAPGSEMITDPEDEALDALLLDEEMTMFELITKGGVTADEQ